MLSITATRSRRLRAALFLYLRAAPALMVKPWPRLTAASLSLWRKGNYCFGPKRKCISFVALSLLGLGATKFEFLSGKMAHWA